MPQPKKAGRFGGTAAHHKLIMSNLVTELMRHGRITTTHAKAKNLQPLADKMVTFAKRGDLAARREVLRVIRDRDVVHKLFADVGPAFAQRDGGYTRVLKLGPRKGDAAPMALIELVEGVARDGEGLSLDEAPRRRWSLRRRRGTRSAAAQARAEDRAAAVDRGEEPEVPLEEGGEPAQGPLAGDEVSEASEEEERPDVTPEEVEARLASDEDAEAPAEPGDGDGGEPPAEEIERQTDSASPTADDEDGEERD